ncbi:GAF domain-containing sensor histidine kinase [Halorarum halophilum]|uniref:histidine kinase n=1 Tax=Halorarum halophilum TaxID=2743090 RepID=A0A7D5KMX3_9EURY|nr:GAF domain-containing sensor histidine kinase [Halobaculum halophilum]QLG27962.1 GAF domain-containing sensor histidine kinase [Halobaculum halophilum]
MSSRDGQDVGSNRVTALYAATRDLLTAPDREALCAVAVETAEEILGFPFTSIHLLDDDGLEPVATTDVIGGESGDVRAFVRGGPVWDVYASGEALTVNGVEWAGHEVHAGVVVPIGEHGVLVAGGGESDGVSDATLKLARLLAENSAVALDRLERERQLDQLHKAARELMAARDTAAVAAAATNAAHEILGLRVNAVHLVSSAGERLVPVSVTEEARELLGDVPDLEPGSVGWRAFESKETIVHDDVRNADSVQNPDTPLRSEVVLPLGDHGVFIAGTDEVDAFDESDLGLAHVFADNVEAALDRAEREATLRTREAELKRQNERLEEFASVVSHDLRNPLNVAQGRLELARDEVDNEHLGHIEEAHDRMADLIEDLLSLARTGQALGEVESVALTPLVREVWTTVPGGDLTMNPDLGTVDANASRLRELLENLFRNAVEHASEDVAVEVDTLPDAAGFYVADDGPGVPPEDREAVFERGFTTAAEGTGFGLPIVREIVEAHGWRISLTESDGGGARFEIRTDPE